MPPENSRHFTVRELTCAAKQIAEYLELDAECLNDFHAYNHLFAKPPGSNVYLNVLQDALRMRGLTLDRFRAEVKERNAS